MVGNPWNAAVSVLKQEYKEDETSLQDALDHSIKVGKNLNEIAPVALIIFRFSPRPWI